MEFIALRFGKIAEALGDRPWPAGDFSVADIAMATVLREAIESGAVAEPPTLEAYLAPRRERPAFDPALKGQLPERTRACSGKRLSRRIAHGGRRINKKKQQTNNDRTPL